ncbi:MAG TPA: hypothetical protein VMP67_05080 [Candidatus Limnocylindria bacterium]|nr:hypothetical protein [Candidatus Limnocylindria bacterium]
MADATADARQELERARRRAESELDELGLATRSALDIPAKIRRNPLKTAGLAGGAAFLAVGGPKRVIRAAERRVFPKRRDRLESILPKDVARVVDRLGDDAERVRANLEQDFMHYLERKHPEEAPNAQRSFWRTYDILAGSLGTLAARTLAKRLFEAPSDRHRERD